MSDVHPRTKIRQAVVDRLKAHQEVDGQTLWATPAGERVFPGRELPTSVSLLPAILVYDDKERPGGEYYQGVDKRIITLTVEVQVTARTAEELDLLMDAAALAVERVLMAEPTFGGLATATSYSGTEKQRDFDGEVPFAWLWLDWEIEYPMSTTYQPDSLDDFLVFHAEYDLAPTDGNIDAVDDVNLPPPE
jgi:hypothetical protein